MTAANLLKLAEKLEGSFPDLPLKYNVSWSEMTWLGVGGEIGIVAEPTDDISLAALLRFCHRRKIPVFVIGGGSNIVGMDETFDGVMIRLSQNDFVRIKAGNHHLTVGAGVRLSDLVETAARRGFGGIAPLAPIPGTLGGALRMNAGAHGVTIGKYVVDICGYDLTGMAVAIDARDVRWDYRATTIPEDVIITGVIMQLPAVDREGELEQIAAAKRQRREHDPSGRSAGCVFKNVSPDDPAGRLIDEAGLKECCCGAALVSNKHANFIINRKHASEKDIVCLMSRMRAAVAERTGFYLRPEVVFFNPDDLARVEAATPSPTVAVLKGGGSSEREISLLSGAAIGAALINAGYRVEEIDLKTCKLSEAVLSADVIFPALHGGWGENGGIQRLLEKAGLSFVGCGSKVSELVFDKIRSKKLMEQEAIPTPEWTVITESDAALPDGLEFPLVVKPPRDGSTVGVFIVNDRSEYEKILPEAFKYDSELLAEKFIRGSEITVAIVNDDVLPVIEIVPPTGFYDYDAKYLHKNGETQYLCPPVTVSPEIQGRAAELALKFYRAANCRDLLRVDFMLDKNGTPYMLEGNNIPGFTSSSLVPKAFRQSKGSMEKLCTELVRAALKRRPALK
ncbi:MAG: UDP-N-acetylmuramate dehydrogenase [Victivallaceae bacterium]|nr:UDP-N-acetylmuramate dehydrogenase [Victivallaceae bacterium]